MRKYGMIALLVFCMLNPGMTQDTFSIIALDSSSRSVGSAGASFVDLVALEIEDATFLAEHLPDVGGIHTQAATDIGDQPFLSVSVSMPSGSGIEPIDSMEVLLNKEHPCEAQSD